MRKTYTVNITIDDTVASENGATTAWQAGTGTFHVTVNRGPNKEPLADMLAHELGHVVTTILETSTWTDDPRTQAAKEHRAERLNMRYAMFGVPKDDAIRMLAYEKETWDYTERILGRASPVRSVGENSYKELIPKG